MIRHVNEKYSNNETKTINATRTKSIRSRQPNADLKPKRHKRRVVKTVRPKRKLS